MNLILRQYKEDSGAVSFPKVLSIPMNSRLPELAKTDFERILKLVVGAITVALENINLKKTLNALQILDLSEMIIDASGEDNLSMEDLMLFLQRLVKGEYNIPGAVMDMGTFMKLFEAYRQERHVRLLEYRENEHLQYKSMGDASRSAKEDPLSEHFSKLGDTLSGLKESLRETKKENQKLKDIDKF